MRQLSSAPEGHLSRTLGSPRSGAEGGEPGVRCSTAAFPPERSGGGNDKAQRRSLPRPLERVVRRD
jgi:hypothetical protein